MKQFELEYEQPYEYDDDSPSGFGDHGISYQRSIYLFRAINDEEAVELSRNFLSSGGLEFGLHWGSPPAGLYPRRFVSLREIYDRREVSLRV